MYLPGKSCVRAAFILEVPVLKQLIAWNISTLDFVKFALIKDKVQFKGKEIILSLSFS